MYITGENGEGDWMNKKQGKNQCCYQETVKGWV